MASSSPTHHRRERPQNPHQNGGWVFMTCIAFALLYLGFAPFLPSFRGKSSDNDVARLAQINEMQIREEIQQAGSYRSWLSQQIARRRGASSGGGDGGGQGTGRSSSSTSFWTYMLYAFVGATIALYVKAGVIRFS